MTLLITGTGSLAKRIMYRFKDKYSKIVAFSRDEYKHTLLPEWVTSEIGDIRDYDRLDFVFKSHKPDIVIATSSLKHVNLSEYYPMEFVKTNIIGTDNTARACHLNGVKKALFVNTDKSVSPVSTYGSSKQIARSIWTDFASRSDTNFLSVLYANVLKSRGSIIPIWEKNLLENKPLVLTHEECTRFMFTLDDSVTLIEKALNFGFSGDCIVPVMDSFRMVDVIKALGIIHDKKPEIVSENKLRPGEKLHEEMMTEMEMTRSYYLRDNNGFDTNYVSILPTIKMKLEQAFLQGQRYTGKVLRSDNFINNNIDELVSLINKSYVD